MTIHQLSNIYIYQHTIIEFLTKSKFQVNELLSGANNKAQNCDLLIKTTEPFEVLS